MQIGRLISDLGSPESYLLVEPVSQIFQLFCEKVTCNFYEAKFSNVRIIGLSIDDDAQTLKNNALRRVGTNSITSRSELRRC